MSIRDSGNDSDEQSAAQTERSAICPTHGPVEAVLWKGALWKGALVCPHDDCHRTAAPVTETDKCGCVSGGRHVCGLPGIASSPSLERIAACTCPNRDTLVGNCPVHGDHGYRRKWNGPSAAREQDYIVEVHVVVSAQARTDAEVLGERAIKEMMRAETPRSAGVARIVNVYIADVRGEDDDDAAV